MVPTMVTSLVGNNSFALKQRLDALTNSFVSENGEFALERIFADESDFKTIIDAIQNLPFLANKKMVVVKNLSANKQAADNIEQIISSADDSINLVIFEPELDKRKSYFKVLKNKTELEEYSELDVHHLSNWLVEEAKKRGANMSLGDANYLVERIGTNQNLISNELDKLVSYDSKIDRKSIDFLTEPIPQSKVFDLLDAAFNGNKIRALKLYEEQRAQKVEPQAILAMIAWQLQLMAIAKYADGKSPAGIAKDLGMNPYPVSKAANLAHKLSDKKFKAMVNEAAEIDLRSKTSSLDLDEALKTYIVTL
jgi:DNA polymerase III subunit delta